MVSTMTVSSATRRLEAARALAPTIRAETEGTEARHELLSQLFETIADAGFLHMALARGLRCPELAGPAAWAGLGEPRVSRRSARETPQ
jgi:hypothetical protein